MSENWKALLQIVLIGAGFYLALVALVYFYQPKLLFLPNIGGRRLIATPTDIGLDYEEVWLKTDDGVRIHGWFVPGGGSGHALLFFHGNAGNISHRLESLRLFQELGLDVLMVDYRGYGQSEGRPSERGTRRDALAAWEYLTGERGYEPGEIVLFGRSLGASVAAQLARERRPAALVLESTFTSVPDMGSEIYPWLPVRLLSTLNYDTRAVVAEFDFPVMVVHSPEDDIIPYHHGRRIFAAAPGPKRFLEIRGPHNGGYLQDRERYLEGWRSFLASLRGAAAARHAPRSVSGAPGGGHGH